MGNNQINAEQLEGADKRTPGTKMLTRDVEGWNGTNSHLLRNQQVAGAREYSSNAVDRAEKMHAMWKKSMSGGLPSTYHAGGDLSANDILRGGGGIQDHSNLVVKNVLGGGNLEHSGGVADGGKEHENPIALHNSPFAGHPTTRSVWPLQSFLNTATNEVQYLEGILDAGNNAPNRYY